MYLFWYSTCICSGFWFHFNRGINCGAAEPKQSRVKINVFQTINFVSVSIVLVIAVNLPHGIWGPIVWVDPRHMVTGRREELWDAGTLPSVFSSCLSQQYVSPGSPASPQIKRLFLIYQQKAFLLHLNGHVCRSQIGFMLKYRQWQTLLMFIFMQQDEVVKSN